MPRKAQPLTDYVIRTLKPAKDQVGWKNVTDGGCKGLTLRMAPKGEKIWVVRVEVNGKRTWQPIGGYPSTSLTDAREKAKSYAASARDGLSPTELNARQRAETMTVATAHAEYIEAMRPALRASTINLKEAMVRDHVIGPMGKRLIRTVRRADVVDVVGSVAAKGFTVQANRVFSEVMALLRWCEQKGYVDGVPSARKKDVRAAAGAKKENSRRRVLSDAEITATWSAAADLGDLTGDFLRLLMLTGQRRDEVRLMTWNEVDMDAKLWVIPKSRYKTGSQTNIGSELLSSACQWHRQSLQQKSTKGTNRVWAVLKPLFNSATGASTCGPEHSQSAVKCAIKLHAWLRKGGILEFRQRDALRAVDESFTLDMGVGDALRILQAHGYLQECEFPPYDYRGRRPSPWYLVNPAIFGA